jgi:hypothetical protein
MATLRIKLIILSCIFLSVVPALAQVTGSITGTVRDSNGAVIPGASVSVYNSDRGVHRDTATNSTR